MATTEILRYKKAAVEQVININGLVNKSTEVYESFFKILCWFLFQRYKA